MEGASGLYRADFLRHALVGERFGARRIETALSKRGGFPPAFGQCVRGSIVRNRNGGSLRIAFFPDAYNEVDGVANTSRQLEDH